MTFTKTFHGFVENTADTLLIVEACRNGILPIVNRRPVDKERNVIKSGTIIVFDESASGIKRWTDGFLWSPSRILGSFLVYRELANRENRKSNDEICMQEMQRERALVGSLTTSNTTYNFKDNGLIKKTIRIMVNGKYFHIVNYYTKYDVFNHLLPTPSTSPELACLHIAPDLLSHLHHPSPLQQQPQFTLSRKRNNDHVADEDRMRRVPFMLRQELPPPMQNRLQTIGCDTMANRFNHKI